MRKAVFVFSLLFTFISVTAQFEKDSLALIIRIDSFYKHNVALDYEKMMDFLYPKIFTLSPREDVKTSMEATFDNEDVSMKMDSLKTVKIFPVFTIDSGTYVKITYSMILTMTYKKPDEDSSYMKNLLDIMQGQYGTENVRLDSERKSLILSQKVEMAGIIDDLSPEWTFVTISKDDPMMEMILSKEIISRFYSN